MDCKECDVLDVNCYEQCKDEPCVGCFGASINDCADCKYNKESENE